MSDRKPRDPQGKGHSKYAAKPRPTESLPPTMNGFANETGNSSSNASPESSGDTPETSRWPAFRIPNSGEELGALALRLLLAGLWTLWEWVAWAATQYVELGFSAAGNPQGIEMVGFVLSSLVLACCAVRCVRVGRRCHQALQRRSQGYTPTLATEESDEEIENGKVGYGPQIAMGMPGGGGPGAPSRFHDGGSDEEDVGASRALKGAFTISDDDSDDLAPPLSEPIELFQPIEAHGDYATNEDRDNASEINPATDRTS